MARKTEKRTIDGITFEVTQLGFAKSRQAFVRLAKAVGPALAKIADSAPSLADMRKIAPGSLAEAVETLISNVGDSDLEWFADVFGSVTRYSVDGERWPFLRAEDREELFSGRILLFFAWLAFALEVNYSDFLSVLAPPPAADRGREEAKN